MQYFDSLINEITEKSVIVQKSKFIAYTLGVKDAFEALKFVNSISKKHFEATHNCFAWLTINSQKYSDNGEPQGTAGLPIFECIKNSKLMNVAIVVVRYFGGIKLGTGGLKRAYTQAALEAISASKRVKYSTYYAISVDIEYSLIESVLSLISKHGRVTKVDYASNVNVLADIDKDKYFEFMEYFKDLTQGKIELVVIDEHISLQNN